MRLYNYEIDNHRSRANEVVMSKHLDFEMSDRGRAVRVEPIRALSPKNLKEALQYSLNIVNKST